MIFVGWRRPEAHSTNLVVIQAYLSRTFHITVDLEEKPSETGPSRFSEVIDRVVEHIDQLASEKLAKLSPKEFDVVIAHIVEPEEGGTQ